MALTAYPNSLSFSDIETEFGGLAGPPVAPATRMSISLSNYYSGGNYVPANTSNAAGGSPGGVIPSGGNISVGDFHGSQKVFVFNVTYSGTRSDTNVLQDAIAAGWNSYSSVPIIINCTVATGAILQASTTANYGLTVYRAMGWPSGSVMNLTITSGSYIIGKGGQGGNGEGYVGTNGGNFVGAGGGAALIINIPTAFINNGVICGGGGGGGGGYWAETGGGAWSVLGGGGGGGGNYGGGGIANTGFNTSYAKVGDIYTDTHTRGGDAGGFLNGGAGGSGGYVGGYGNNRYGYGGGNGGSYANAGTIRQTSYSPNYYDGNGNPVYYSRPYVASVSATPGAGGYSYYGANYVTSYTGSGNVYGASGGNT